MSRTIQVTLYDENGNEYEAYLPARRIVCDRCDGEGGILNPSIGEHAYTAEEFRESFDDDEANEYFKGGQGMYGVTCPECEGQKVRDVVDCKRAEKETPKNYAAWLETEEQRRRNEAEDAAERRMGA